MSALTIGWLGSIARKVCQRVFRDPPRAFRERRRLLRRSKALSANPRPSSGPFLSGDTFRCVCDVSYGDTADAAFDPENLVAGAKVFCCSHALEEFFRDISPRIGVPFVLVSGNSDQNVKVTRVLPPNLLRWYAQNLQTPGERVLPLPIGLENAHYWNNGDPDDFRWLRSRRTGAQKNKIYYGFSTATNPAEREPLLRTAQASALCETRKGLDSWEYRRVVRRYRFVLSPEGNGLDCHRTWEAMYLGVIPVVKTCPMTEAFYAMGFPLLLLASWDDLSDLTAEQLEAAYEQERRKLNTEKLWLPYWAAQLDGDA